MVFQVNGEFTQSELLYEKIFNNKQYNATEESRYKKLEIFNNEETSINFYKSNRVTNKIIITFDSLHMTWNNPSFGFKLLTEQNIDIITVQKKQKKTYHQDLLQGVFLETVSKLVQGYSFRYSYGFSLGGYMVLYYTARLDCTILSIAPRLSIHPIYGQKKEIGKMPVCHNLKLSSNADIQPIIVYDPHDSIDSNYVKKEILSAYPNANLVKIPYGGHSMAPHLLRMGLLKEFILKVINENEIPVYKKHRRTRSANYFRILGRKCLRRNKNTWAKGLANRAYELLPEDPPVVMLQVDVLIRFEKYIDAEKIINNALVNKPRNISYTMKLIDIIIYQNNLLKAEEELNLASSKFGDNLIIRKKRRKIDLEMKAKIKSDSDFFNLLGN